MAKVFQCDASGVIGERGGVIFYDADPDDSDAEPKRKEVCKEVWEKLLAILEPAPRKPRGPKAKTDDA